MPFLLTSCDEDGNPVFPTSGLTDSEVILGLKEALRVGTDSSVSNLSATNGYLADAAVKIFLPPEVNTQLNTLESKVNSAGLLKPVLEPLYNELIGNTKEKMITSLNRAAEDAAVKAKPIFVSAITNISIQDGFDILNGEDTAATSYLRRNTYDSLFGAFQPDINTSLDKDLVSGASANDVFSTYVTSYNEISSKSLGLIDPINDISLSEYVTAKGLNGLFLKVGEEEKNIRENPLNRVTDILERVFGN